MVQKQGEKRQLPLLVLHDEQEMDIGGGDEPPHDEVPAGHTEF